MKGNRNSHVKRKGEWERKKGEGKEGAIKGKRRRGEGDGV